MQQKGIIVSVSDSYASVAVRRQTSCGQNCAQCKGCEVLPKHVQALNSIGAKAGDNVIIEIPTKTVLLSAFSVYILPLFSAVTVYSFTESGALALGTFAAIFAVIGLADKLLAKSSKFRSKIIKIL